MWKIKLNSKSEELSVIEEKESDLKMKSDISDGEKGDTNTSAQKKLKQARLPFQILSPRSSSTPVKNDSENTVKKRKLSDDSHVEGSKSKLCKTEVKENVCEPASFNDVIVIEDSVDKDELEENCVSEGTSLEEESKGNLNDKMNAKKRVLNSEDITDCENDVENKIVKKSKILLSEDNKDGMSNEYSCEKTDVCGHSDDAKKDESNKSSSLSQTTNRRDVNSSCNSPSENNDSKYHSKSSNSKPKEDIKKLNETPSSRMKLRGKKSINNNRGKSLSFRKRTVNNKKGNAVKTVEQICVKTNSVGQKLNKTKEKNPNFSQNSNIVKKKSSSSCKITAVTNENKKVQEKENSKTDDTICVISPDEVENIEQKENSKTEGSLSVEETSKKILEINYEKKNIPTSSEKSTLITHKNKVIKENSNMENLVSDEGTPKKPVEELHEIVDINKTPQDNDTESDSAICQDSQVNYTSAGDDVQNKNKTPKSATKRRLTPKQVLKREESEKKHKERLKQRMEKERLRKEKEEKINQLKEERKRLKLEKEESKKREKEEKEKKRQMELELKNEEKKAKEEEKKAKEEEKRKREEAKEEEKRKRDEAKEEERRKKEAEKRKEEKAATAFASFFTPKRSEGKSSLAASSEDVTDSAVGLDKFMPFEVKGDMRLAAICRRTLETENLITLDNALQDQNHNRNYLYLEQLKSKQHTPLCDGKTWTSQDDAEDDVIVIESEVVEDDIEEEKKLGCGKKRLQRPRAKLLQFHENRRPPYWGTWRKKSSVIGPRKPFGQDNAMFEYDIDSDDEWEEEEPGESLHGSDDEKESEDEYEVDNKLFVPHGYLSDEEAKDEIEDLSPEAQKAKLRFLEMEFEAEMKEKTEKLKPRLIGCVWFDNSIEDPKSVGSHIAELLLSRRAVVWDNVTVPIDIEQSSSLSSSPISTPAKVEQNKITKSNIFPESAVPSLIKLVHGNRFKHKFLVEEFYNFMLQNSKSITELPSKNSISNKKREISEWMVYPQEENSNHPMIGRRCWYVTRELREKYGILDQTSEEDIWMYSLEVPRINTSLNSSNAAEQVSPVTPITKFTKVLSHEERQKQLTLQSPVANENEKQGMVTPVSSKKAVKNTSSGRARRSVMDAFMKAKSVKKKDNLTSPTIEIIELSPEKPVQDSVNEMQEVDDPQSDTLKNSNCNTLPAGDSVTDQLMVKKPGGRSSSYERPAKPAVTTSKPIKRIKPICLSPKKLKKKL